jgi:hypothetical protein
MNFIQQPLPNESITGAGLNGQSGALGLGQRVANAIASCKFLIPLPPQLRLASARDGA